jgi:hypothetical protein
MAEDKPIGRIYALIPKIMGEVGAIGKNRQTEAQGKYWFRGIDDVYQAMQGPLSRNGVFYVPEVLKRDVIEKETRGGGALFYTTLTVKYTFFAPDGSNVTCIVVGEAMDTSDKSSNKAMSAALKYAIFQIFCIPTEEDNDTENSHHEPVAKPEPKAQPLNIKVFMDTFDAACKARGMNVDQMDALYNEFLGQIGVKDIADAPREDCASLIRRLKSGEFDSFALETQPA